MNNDDSTAYICIYCPFNSDNLQALEYHLTEAHGHGCHDTPSTNTNNSEKTKRKASPNDEQLPTSFDDEKLSTGSLSGVKRIKRISSSSSLSSSSSSTPKTSSILYINGNDQQSDQGDASKDAHNGDDDDNDNGVDNDVGNDDDDHDVDDDDDERDSPANRISSSSQILLTCPTCGSTYHRLGHLIRHAKRKHHVDLSNYEGPPTFDILTKEIKPIENHLEVKLNRPTEFVDTINGIASETTSIQQNASTASSVSESHVAATQCPYCEFKTTDMEQFKIHIAAHIRDKNYRCLLCNRLYKYRGDCSFHIRRKHHRYSANSNDYIQRFLFDTNDEKDSNITQSGGNSSLINSSTNILNISREQDEPVRYFGCPYCDYTSNYGGDVRKHQARKHPNLESKVLKIVRQDSEQQTPLSFAHLNSKQGETPVDPSNEKHHDNLETITNSNLLEQSISQQKPRKEKIKTVKKMDITNLPPNPAALAIPPNFAPVRVFQCSSCHQQGTYKWVVERHIRAKHPDQHDAHVIELPAELAVKLQKITPPLKRYRCSLCPLQSKHTWVIIRHIKHFHTLQTASVLDIQPDGSSNNDESFRFQNEDFTESKSFNHDSDSSSNESSPGETPIHDEHLNSFRPVDDDDEEHDEDESDHNPLNTTIVCLYKCSLCDFTSNVSWTTQNHINELHPGQTNVHMITQYRSTNHDANTSLNLKKFKGKDSSQTTIPAVTKTAFSAPLSPASALAKAKFSPEVEKAFLDLQNSKLKNPGLYAVQPKFGIKRLKCRHCFYRSNWKTDMIRHVRIRHNLTEPDHNKDMITMTEDEARSTIETYENTFGKELRRRTFRTWNDWAKAEQEFTPKDGSLDYLTNINNGEMKINEKSSKAKTQTLSNGYSKVASTNDSMKRSTIIPLKHDVKVSTSNFDLPSSWVKDDFKQLSNASNIVSRLLLTSSPSNSNDDDAPLDLSIKTSSNAKEAQTNDYHESDSEENEGENPNLVYLCSVCPYKHSNISAVQRHINIHLTGQGIMCPLCSYTSSTRNSMNRHFITDHPNNLMLHEFPSAKQSSNVEIVERHQCPLCSYQCDQAEGLNIHRRLEHADEDFDVDSSVASTTSETNVKEDSDRTAHSIYQCQFCSPMFDCSHLEEFTMHIFTHHAQHLENNQSCPFCSFVAHTTSIYSISEHIKLHFNGTLVQPDAQIGYEHVKELFIG